MRSEAWPGGHAFGNAGAVEGKGGCCRNVILPEIGAVGQVLRPAVLHVESAREAFAVQGGMAVFQEEQFVEKEAHMPGAQFVIFRLPGQAVGVAGDGVGDAGQFAVFGEQVLVAKFLRRYEIDAGHGCFL